MTARTFTREEIAQLLAEATPGPWVPSVHNGRDDVDRKPDDTDLEYRGANGKWTIATVYGDGSVAPDAWADRFIHAADDVRALLDEIARLTDGTMVYDSGSHRAYVEGVKSFRPNVYPASSMRPATYRNGADRQAFFCGWHDAQNVRRRRAGGAK